LKNYNKLFFCYDIPVVVFYQVEKKSSRILLPDEYQKKGFSIIFFKKNIIDKNSYFTLMFFFKKNDAIFKQNNANCQAFLSTRQS